jgi:hypothetical protein
MARTLRIVNAFFAALFVAMAIVSLAFVSAGRDGFTGEPDGRTALAWAALFVLLALLAFVNMRRAGSEQGRGLILLNLAAAVPLALGLVAAEGIRFLCGAAAFPFALTALLLILAGRPRNPA